LKRYQQAQRLHFITFSCYRCAALLASVAARRIFEQAAGMHSSFARFRFAEQNGIGTQDDIVQGRVSVMVDHRGRGSRSETVGQSDCRAVYALYGAARLALDA
jgi:hypothetical protein